MPFQLAAAARLRERYQPYASQQTSIHSKLAHAEDCTDSRVHEGSATEDLDRILNEVKSRVRSKVEHVLAVVKRLRRFSNVRYRGLARAPGGLS